MASSATGAARPAYRISSGTCSARTIGPTQVDDRVLDQYLEYLEATALKPNPRSCHRSVCRAWNRAVATAPVWPPQRVTVPNYRTEYSLALSCFPESLNAEIRLWCDYLQGKDPTDEDRPPRPVTPRTAATRGYQLRQLSSALVHRGHNPADLVSLSMVVRPAPLREALRFFLDRAGGQTTKQIHELAHAAATVARYHLKLPEEELQRIRRLRKSLAVQQHGMTERNRATLRQFDDPRRWQRSFSLALGNSRRRNGRMLARCVQPVTLHGRWQSSC